MKLLYVSCHSCLEYDELKLFHELGIDVFSHGAYVDPRDNGDDPKRPPLDIPYYPELCQLARASSKEALAGELIEWADIVYFMGIMSWIVDNWPQMVDHVKAGRKRVIWRSIGQSNTELETTLAAYVKEGLELVRHSEAERQIPGYLDGWPLIRFYKDEQELGPWTGEVPRVISVGQQVKHRDQYCGLTWLEQATEGMDRLMIGPHNEDITTMPSAMLSYNELKEALRRNRAFFYTGTYPAPYTLGFVEALMSGIPVVAIGPRLRNHHFGGGDDSYEIPLITENGYDCFWSDDMERLRGACQMLIADHARAAEVGMHGRELAMRLFSKQVVGLQWRQFFRLGGAEVGALEEA